MAGTAIFDMDRTLTRQGTWSRFMFGVNKTRPLFYARLPLLGLHAVAYKLGLCSRRSVKEHGLRTLGWARRADLEHAAAKFADAEVANGLRRHTRAVLDAHRARGDRLVMATAAVGLVANPIAERLGFDLVIATDVAWTADDRLDPVLASENCYGEEKLTRVRSADGTHTFARPITAYSDHVTDQPLLAWADTGIAVNPSSGLRRVSKDAGFPIHDWDAPDLPPNTNEIGPSQ